jgi:creatinine amidohydrolase
VLTDVEHEIFDDPGDHAGEMERSPILACRPKLVARKADGTLAADAGAMAETKFHAVNRGWVSITRPWHLLTTKTGAGNPHGAMAEKDRRAIPGRIHYCPVRRAFSVLNRDEPEPCT